MKVNKKFILRKVAKEHLLIPTGEMALKVKGLVAMSESANLLYQKLQTGCTRDDLIAALLAEYDVPAGVAAEDVDAFLDQMRQLEMLVED